LAVGVLVGMIWISETDLPDNVERVLGTECNEPEESEDI
jgi:hypothetical protein